MSIAVFSPALASAQTSTHPQDASVTPAPDVEAAPPAQHSKGARLAAEGGVGLALTLGSGVGGAFVGALGGELVAPTDPVEEDIGQGAMIGALVGGGLGPAFATPAGVYMGGHWMGGRGTYTTALLGSIVGTVVGYGGGLLLSQPTGSIGPLLILGTVGPIAGSMIGYEMSLPGPGERQASAGGAAIQPWVSVSPTGGRAAVGFRAAF